MLVGSAADTFAAEEGGANRPRRPVRRRDRRDDGRAERPVSTPRSRTCPRRASTRDRFPGLELVGPPESHGYYVIYVRTRDEALRDALDRGIGRLIASGELRRLYENYGIWNEAQDELTGVQGADRAGARAPGRRRLAAGADATCPGCSTRPG